MRILITNDDGINARGLSIMERIAHEMSDDVWVVAPETDQSGLAHSLTLNEPLRLRDLGDKRYAVRGTPTDCVIMAVSQVLDGKPDLVLSGVNAGHNIADAVTYSGTVAGAMEGAVLGIRSIALSQAYHFEDGEKHIPWETAARHGPEVIDKLLGVEPDDGTFFNVNFPNCMPESVAGTLATEQARMDMGMFTEQRRDGRGQPYYWLRFGGSAREQDGDTDFNALQRNLISVTPLTLDLTARRMMDRVGASLR